MARQRQRRASSHEQDDVRPRQPAWREQAPARPRKRVKHKQATAPLIPDGSGRRGKANGRSITLPSREAWATVGRIAMLLLTAIAATVGLIYLLSMPELAVGRASTQLSGSLRIPPEEIYTGSGIDGQNVLQLRAEDVEAAVESIPGVANAAVHVRLPNQVIIDITEHAPLVAWQAITGTVWLAADGAEVPQSGAAPPLTFTDQSNGRLDKDPALRELLLENLRAVHAASPELAEFYYADEPGLYYVASGGWQVWLGESGPMEDKLALAEATSKDLAKESARPRLIDLRQSGQKAIQW